MLWDHMWSEVFRDAPVKVFKSLQMMHAMSNSHLGIQVCNPYWQHWRWSPVCVRLEVPDFAKSRTGENEGIVLSASHWSLSGHESKHAAWMKHLPVLTGSKSSCAESVHCRRSPWSSTLLISRKTHTHARMHACTHTARIWVLAGEKLWRMPMEDSYLEHLQSPIADLKNTGIQHRYGGAINASLFLKELSTPTRYRSPPLALHELLAKHAK